MSLSEAHPSEPAVPPEVVLEEATRRLAELAEAVAARDNFIAVAAHELRNPMTPMIGQIELLLKGVKANKCSPSQIEDRLERIHRAMSHYLKRAATLLDVSRITSGKFRLALAPCDLGHIVREIAETFDEAARHTGASIKVDAPDSLPGIWDRLALEHIIDNLVSNAVKYGGKKPVVVSVEDPGNATHVLIRVRDHGPGISSGDRARIFGQFERAVGLNENQTGFGVGLWVVGQVVEAMKGEITVNDAQGGGTIFQVVLPRHLKADAQ
jgi:two-component system, OmpR family, sensor kinase